jgi:hypothetical protein
MTLIWKFPLAASCLLASCAFAAAADFSAFGEDEEICRHAGEAAIQGATGPTAAQRYDMAHGQCMAAHARLRWMNAYRDGPPPVAFAPGGNPDNFHYPEAFTGIPYATPGYGYDGFSR